MPKYPLRHPLHPQQELRKHGQSGLWPIFKGVHSNDYFMLLADGSMTRRWLVQYDPLTASIIRPRNETGEFILTSENTYPVPDDWEGEP